MMEAKVVPKCGVTSQLSWAALFLTPGVFFVAWYAFDILTIHTTLNFYGIKDKNTIERVAAAFRINMLICLLIGYALGYGLAFRHLREPGRCMLCAGTKICIRDNEMRHLSSKGAHII